MKRVLFYPLFMAMFLFAASCGQKRDNITQEQVEAKTQTQDTSPVPQNNTGSAANTTSGQFAYPELPATIVDPVAQANYMTDHFWDSFNFNDTISIHQPLIKDRAFADYIVAMRYADKKVADKSIEKVLSKAETEKTGVVYAFFIERFKTYLYDPNSPIREDEYYIPVLQYMIASEHTGYADRERAKFDLEMAMKNRVGEKAVNFTYTLASGKTGSLYDIKAKYTILLFYNPDCNSCGEMTAQLKASQLITQKIKSGEIRLLAFYPDEDLSIWQEHLSEIPAAWINGYDKEQKVKLQKLYDLKVIPTLYLLDADKRVLLKDISIRALDRYLPERP